MNYLTKKRLKEYKPLIMAIMSNGDEYYAYDIVKKLPKEMQKSAEFHIYTILMRMVKHGDLSSRVIDKGKHQYRRLYKIARGGRRVVKEPLLSPQLAI